MVLIGEQVLGVMYVEEKDVFNLTFKMMNNNFDLIDVIGGGPSSMDDWLVSSRKDN